MKWSVVQEKFKDKLMGWKIKKKNTTNMPKEETRHFISLMFYFVHKYHTRAFCTNS